MKIVRLGVKPPTTRNKWAGKRIFCPRCKQVIILDDDDDSSPHYFAPSCGRRYWRCTCCEELLELGTEAPEDGHG